MARGSMLTLFLTAVMVMASVSTEASHRRDRHYPEPVMCAGDKLVRIDGTVIADLWDNRECMAAIDSIDDGLFCADDKLVNASTGNILADLWDHRECRKALESIRFPY